MVCMKKLNDEVRGKLIVQLMKIVNTETTVSDLEIVITGIERILLEENILK